MKKKITRLTSVTPWVTHDFQKTGFLLTMTLWSFFSVWVKSPDSEHTVMLQHRLAFMPSLNCCGASCLPGHSHGAQRWGLAFHLLGAMIDILAISIKFHHCRNGRVGSDTNAALQWFRRNAQSLWLVFGVFIGCALPARFLAYLARGTHMLLLWNLISFFLFCTLTANLLHNKPAD